MMSAAQSQTTLESKLEALQCHFTWNLDPSRSELLRRSESLEDIGTEEGNSWLGHIYNLRGFIQYKLGFTEDAQSFFSRAAEAFRQIRHRNEGPWLMVNYGNLAWLHHHLGNQAESQSYLSKVDALINQYPSPSPDELHPEIYAEKAWTLMKFSGEKKLIVDYFQRAIKMQPDMVEWNTSHTLELVHAFKHIDEKVEAEIFEKLRIAREQDPENLYLAAYYLEQCAKLGERIEDEARELARKVLRNPVGSYGGIKPLLWIYRNYISVDEAIALAEEALKKHPDERYLKRCASLCYKWIIYFSDRLPERSKIDRAIRLHEEVISLYPHSSLMKKVDLANIYAKSNYSQAKAEQIFQELLERDRIENDLEPTDKQMLYNNYAKRLFFDHQEDQKAVQYHMKAAAIQNQSSFRANSIRFLERIKDKDRSPMCREIAEFLENLKEL
ncbi:interferon-induced protein with tetratricopeptide repeats 5-like [Epinephelus moara]|uniref:interferon-induced protein with tetratricopeptide repeats 5-like n=1 Tax=Epinephelus moara TaxID=300413 RepID=UPI00214EA51E|nr:interferon-induced protein with tetratricopeptide repeats 5-like [Epinephelus moara]